MNGEILNFLLKGMKRATQGRNTAASQRNIIWEKISLERADCPSFFSVEFQFGNNIILRGNMIGFKLHFFPFDTFFKKLA